LRPDIAPEAAAPQSRKRHQLNQRICAAVWVALAECAPCGYCASWSIGAGRGDG
jgi:hypothetical protein